MEIECLYRGHRITVMATQQTDGLWRSIYRVNEPTQSTKLTLQGSAIGATRDKAQLAALTAAKQWIDSTD